MAIDTRDKRASALGRGLRFLAIFPAPDGTIDAGDRLQIVGLYRGIAAAAVAAYVPPPTATAAVRGRATAAVSVLGRPIATTIDTP